MLILLKFVIKEDEVGSVGLILGFSVKIRFRLDLSSIKNIENRRSVKFNNRSYRLGSIILMG